MTVLKALLAVVGVVVSVVLFLTAFFKISLEAGSPLLTPRFSFLQFFGEIPHQLHWLLPFSLLTALVLPLRALQWQSTLHRKVPFRERYHLVGIGAFVHNVVPGKLGDITRAFLLARTQKLPFVQGLGSVAVCKLLEFACLMCLVALAFIGPFGETMRRYQGAMRAAIGVCLALVAFVVLLAHFAAPLSRRLARQKKLPKLERFLEHAAAGLGTARSIPGMAKAMLLSFGPVLAPAIGYGIALEGVGVEGGLFAGPVVLGAIALGQATPGIPAGTGIYYFVTSWAARSLGASPEDAAAFAALTHLGTIGTYTLVGAVSVWVRKIKWRDLRRGSREAKDATSEEAHGHGLRSRAEASA
jgi:uncharacterized membrane protein YbhN (UPF0104 family)